MRHQDDLKKQLEIEEYWRKKILESTKGTDRENVVKEAYAAVNAHMDEHDQYHENLNEKALRQFQLLMNVSTENSSPKFLDVGCASGALVLLALSKGWDAYGFDPESNALQIANDKLKDLEVGAKNRFYDNFEDLEENTFDLIFHSDVLEHIHPEDVIDFLSNQYRLLKKDGLLVVVTPYRLCGPKDISKYFLPLGAKATGLHLKEYFLSEMTSLYKRVGYSQTLSYMGNPSSANRLKLKINTSIKVGLEKGLILLNKLGLRYLSCKISQKLGYSLSIAKK